MYRIALSLLRQEKNITLYSFGCGSLLDGISLAHAKKRVAEKWGDQAQIERMNYRGIDLADWPVKFDLNCYESCNFHRIGMEDFADSGKKDAIVKMGCNIISFPKILSENLDRTQGEISIIDRFCDGIKKHKFSRVKIVLCVSYRSHITANEDMKQTRRIVTALEENGYVLEEEIPLREILGSSSLAYELEVDHNNPYDYPVICFRQKDQIYRNMDPAFRYPSEVSEYLKASGTLPIYAENIRSCCEKICHVEDYEERKGKCSQCEYRLKNGDCCLRNPVYKVGLICFQVLSFVKNKAQ